MQRVFPWLAVILAAVIAIVAVFEVDMRSEDMDVALEPTTVPSPTDGAPETMGPVQAPTTEAPTTPTGAPMTPTPETTLAPTATPTPELPTVSPSAPETKDAMPHTGGGAVGGGLLVFALAATLRLAVRRSY